MEELLRKLNYYLSDVYPRSDLAAIEGEVEALLKNQQPAPGYHQPRNKWDASDIFLITYGDSIIQDNEAGLVTLHRFLQGIKETINGVHILPFFPYSSDDGFSVMDYYQVREDLGTWEDIGRIGDEFRLIADLVINHTSRKSVWYENFLRGHGPGHDFFMEADASFDTTTVVRPRPSPVLVPADKNGKYNGRMVWATFSEDQIDLNFKNPRVYIEFVKIIKHYLDYGIDGLRLDAIAFLWKEQGSPCIHLPQTHNIVKSLRLIVEYLNNEAVVLTETNVPNLENLSYFGNQDEAHMIYNFSLPPLLLNALYRGDATHLKTWMMRMPPSPMGCAYFNFLASHDGIGLRPAEGLLEPAEVDDLIEGMKTFGGLISTRTDSAGRQKPYEINITYYDACKGTRHGMDRYQNERFLCAYTVMLALEGIPGIYIQSLLATHNDSALVKNTGRKRSINRTRRPEGEVLAALGNAQSNTAKIYTELLRRIAIRKKQPAFHPNATQYTLQLQPEIFGFWRQSQARDQSIFALNNITGSTINLSLDSMNLITTDKWYDLLAGREISLQENKLILAPYQTVWLSNKQAS